MTLLKIKNLSKSFSGVNVLKDINLDINAGEVHILAGENGAGKSTLIKIISGSYTSNTGTQMLLNGKKYEPKSTKESITEGIRVVYQELNLMEGLSIAENIYFENLPSSFSIVNKKILNTNTKELLKKIGLNISPNTLVSNLGIGQKQLIEIAKAISQKINILVLDEPTATLMPNEIERLFKIITELKNQGIAIIYISHRLQELMDIGDKISILRDGKLISTNKIKDMDLNAIISDMTGKNIENEFGFRSNLLKDKTVFEANNITTHTGVNNVSLKLQKQEILGIAGLVGSKRSELLRAIFGADKIEQGNINIKGKTVKINNPKKAVQNGICLVNEDRKSQGLVLDFECYKNITLTNLNDVSNDIKLVDKQKELEVFDTFHKKMNIKTSSPKKFVRFLSGGNQQKIILSKWLYRNSEIILLDEPTRGIDVGARSEIYNMLFDLTKAGKSLIVVSSDLHELTGICDRILVMSNGSISGELERKNFDNNKILHFAYQNYM